MSSADTTVETPDPARWRALAVCLVAGAMTLLDVSIVNVALPTLRQGLGADDSDVQWIIAGYALAFGVALVPAGRLGDARSRRTIFMVGIALFTLSMWSSVWSATLKLNLYEDIVFPCWVGRRADQIPGRPAGAVDAGSATAFGSAELKLAATCALSSSCVA